MEVSRKLSCEQVPEIVEAFQSATFTTVTACPLTYLNINVTLKLEKGFDTVKELLVYCYV
jgi:hypothetical protein